jgi:hypothetical protein
MCKFMGLWLATFSLLALTFWPACLASNATSDVSRDTLIPDSVGMPYETSNHTLQLISKHLPLLKISRSEFFAAVLDGNPKDGDACLNFLKSLNEEIEALLAAMKADYSTIETHARFWSAVSVCLTEATKSQSLSHLRNISTEEAFNYAVVMIAFEHNVIECWSGFSKLRNLFAPNQWVKFANWAIYVAHLERYVFPPALYHERFLSSKQLTSTLKTLHEVVIQGRAFECDGFYRPSRGTLALNGFDSCYAVVPIGESIWNRENVEELKELLYFSIGHIETYREHGSQLIIKIIPSFCLLIPLLNDDPVLRERVINILISNNVLSRMGEVADAVVALILEADEEMFRLAVEKLDAANKTLIADTLVRIKKSKKVNIQFTLLFQKLKLLEGFLYLQPQSNSIDIFNTIDAVLIQVVELSVQKFDFKTATEAEYSKVCSRLISFNDIEQLLPGCTVFSVLEALMKWTLICYLLANNQQRYRTALNLILAIDCNVRAMGMSVDHSTKLKYDTPVRLEIMQVYGFLQACTPKNGLLQTFTEACLYINQTGQLSNDALNSLVSFAMVTFANERTTEKFDGKVSFLVKLFLLKGGILSGGYAKTKRYLNPSLQAAVYVSAISEWRSDLHTKTAKEKIAFKTFVNWLIDNNCIPRSVVILLSF